MPGSIVLLTIQKRWELRRPNDAILIVIARDPPHIQYQGANEMRMKFWFIAAALLPLSLALAQSAPADKAAQAPATAKAPSAKTAPKADFLFVQSARKMSYDKASNKLTLHDVSPITVFFSDRPERIAGNMETTAFVPFWSKGKDSFLSDPPNADISIIKDRKLEQVVVVLESPTLKGNDLTYTVKVLKGSLPDKGGDVSVFIDIIGMPLTPVSFAGVARRGYRRAVLFR